MKDMGSPLRGLTNKEKNMRIRLLRKSMMSLYLKFPEDATYPEVIKSPC